MITIWVPKRLVEIDLYNVAARSPQALADLSEQSYAQRVDYAAQKVQLSGAKIVMLTGPSASGKTTSAHCLAKALQKRGTPAQVVSLDNFFKGAEFYPRLPDGTLDYENPDTLDLPLIKQCLRELSEMGKTVLPIYDFSAEKRSAEVEPIAASSTRRISACAAAPCGTLQRAAAARKRPLPCGTACWTVRRGISRALKPRQTFCWIPPLPTSWA